MSSPLLHTNCWFPSHTMTNFLDHPHCHVPSLHSKRSPSLKLNMAKCRSSLSPLTSYSTSRSRASSWKLWAASLEDQLPIMIDPHLHPVNNKIESTVGSDREIDTVSAFLHACGKFCRPYALVGTIIHATCLAAGVWIKNAHLITPSLPLKALIGFIAGLCADVFVNGINQIYDVDIDKINKPFLPIASGEISVKSAWGIVLSCVTVGLSLVVLNESGLFITSVYCLFLLFGYLYSAPPFRMKKSPATAFLALIMCQNMLNFGTFYASRAVLGLGFEWSPAFLFITIMTNLYGGLFTLFKDLTDFEGDSKFGVCTLAQKLGSRNTTLLGTGTLVLAYFTAILVAIFQPQAGFKLGVFIPAHVIMAFILIYQAWVLDKANYSKEASLAFYMLIWQVKYAENILFPFI